MIRRTIISWPANLKSGTHIHQMTCFDSDDRSFFGLESNIHSFPVSSVFVFGHLKSDNDNFLVQICGHLRRTSVVYTRADVYNVSIHSPLYTYVLSKTERMNFTLKKVDFIFL